MIELWIVIIFAFIGIGYVLKERLYKNCRSKIKCNKTRYPPLTPIETQSKLL